MSEIHSKESAFEALFASLTGENAALPGVAMAAFREDGIFHSRAAGPLRVDSQDSINLRSGFWGYSCTKPLTTIAVLQCVDRGLIKLDDTVASILPELASLDIITPKPDSEHGFQLASATTPITVRHLLTHTSGLSYDAMNPLLVAWRKSRGEAPLVMSGLVIKACSLPLLFEPGTSWTYGCSLDWAGVLVGRLNGNVTLGEYMATNIFAPLGIRNTSFHPFEGPSRGSHMTQMFCRTAEGALRQIESPYPERAPEDSGGMGITTTPADFATVLSDILKDKPLLLRPETVRFMFNPQFEVGSPQYKAFLKQGNMHAHLTGERDGEPSISFGLGGLVVLDGGVRNLPKNSLSWNGMPNIGWFVNRELGYGALFFIQLVPPADQKSVSLMEAYWDFVHQVAGKKDKQ
ncbi:hypothetical protein Hte_002776 [Hypoxylon texense]